MRNATRPILLISKFVNAMILGVTLLITSCGKTDSAKVPTKQLSIGQLNAVWATPPKRDTIRDISIAGQGAAMIAVAYDYDGLQIFDFNGEEISDTSPVNVLVLADGKTLKLGDQRLVIFPGITTNSELKLYLYGKGINAPVEMDVPIEIIGNVLGVCTDTVPYSGSLNPLRIAYWTTDDPLKPIVGEINAMVRYDEDKNTENYFSWTEDIDYTERLEEPIGSCWFESSELDDFGIPRFETTSLRSTTVFSRDNLTRTLVLNTSGGISSFANGTLLRDYAITDGITVKVPKEPTAISSLNYPTKGGYPNGAILLAGETSPSNSQVVFVDAGPLLTDE